MDESQRRDNDLPGSLIKGITEVGGNIGLLSQADHTGDERRRIATDEGLEAAKTSLLDILEFVKKDTSEENAQSRENALVTIRQTLDGFEYRRENKLPGLRTQFLEARQQLVSGEKATALDILAKQPDAVELVAQLRAEYETFEEVMERGGVLDLDNLETKIRKINHGLDFVSMDEAIGRWRALKDLEQKLTGSMSLAKVQEREELLVRLGQTAKKFESDVAAQAAHNLDSVIARLQMDGVLGHGDENRYHGKFAQLRREHKGVELLSETLKRADRLTVGISEPGFPAIDIEVVTENLRGTDKEIAALKNSSDKLREKLMKWGGIPIVGNRIRAEMDRVFDKLTTTERARRRLIARLEIADHYNSLAGFLKEVGGEKEAEEAKA